MRRAAIILTWAIGFPVVIIAGIALLAGVVLFADATAERYGYDGIVGVFVLVVLLLVVGGAAIGAGENSEGGQ